jgi:hypothetical protein
MTKLFQNDHKLDEEVHLEIVEECRLQVERLVSRSLA